MSASVGHFPVGNTSIPRSCLSWIVFAQYVPGVGADILTGDVGSPPNHLPPGLLIGVRVRVFLSQQAAAL
jgi:hypothetical protein